MSNDAILNRNGNEAYKTLNEGFCLFRRDVRATNFRLMVERLWYSEYDVT